MTSIQPELWVDSPSEALTFYEAAFSATILHRVGDGDDIVAQLGVGEAAFWVAPPSARMKRLSLARSMARRGGHYWWSKIPTSSSAKRWPPARRRSPPRKTSTAGGSAGSSTRSGTNGRSARPLDPGRRLEASTLTSGKRFAPRQGQCPRQDSNLRTRLRRPVLYPLSYEGRFGV